MNLRDLVRRWVPPALAESIRSISGRAKQPARAARFRGAYRTWREAAADAVGYDSEVIFEKTRSATLKVRNGEAVFERDSVVMERPDYPLFLIASLLHVAALQGRLNILDLGGALGSSYFQCRPFVSAVAGLHWSVVEQLRYVECGQRELQTDVLRFYATIADCIQAENPNVAILSGVLQYLEHPYEVVEAVTSQGIDYVVIDRQPLSASKDESVCVAIIPPQLYTGSYPFWLLSEDRFRGAWDRAYDLVAEAEGSPLETHVGLLKRRQLFYARRRREARRPTP
jgi:putative methyltransferase (TIGR04325 family)